MPAPPLTILVVHNHYQQRGGEDSVFETECAMLEAAGHVVLRYEKHNDEIGSGEKRLAASGQRLESEEAKGSGFRASTVSSEWRVESRFGRGAAPDPVSEPASLVAAATAAQGSGFRVQGEQPFAKQAGGACPQDMAPKEPHLNAGAAESARVQATTAPASNDAPPPSQSCNPVKKTFRAFLCFSWLKKLLATSPTKPTSSTATASRAEGETCRNSTHFVSSLSRLPLVDKLRSRLTWHQRLSDWTKRIGLSGGTKRAGLSGGTKRAGHTLTHPHTHTPTLSTPGSGAEPQHQLLTTHYSLLTKFQLFARTIWNSSTYREITEIIQREKPDIVHCHNTFPLISPSVYWAAARQGVPVVQTLHNYRLVCINPYLYRNGRICEDCLGHSPLHGVIHRCYRNSFSASFTVAAMLVIHRLLGTYRNKVTTYIALTEFGRNKFIEARLCDPAKVVVKPNAVAAEAAPAEGLAASGQQLGAEDAQGSGFRVQDQRLAASGQRLGSEGAQGSGFRVKSEEQRLAAPTAQVLGTRYQVLANTASTEDEIATKSHEKPQKAPSSHTEALAASATAEAVPEVLGTRYQVLANTEFDPKDNPKTLAPSTYPLVPEHCCGRPATVLYVGRLSPEKGVDILIAAWKLLMEQRLAASGQRLGGEAAEGSGVGVQEEETLSRALSQTLSNQEQELGEATSSTKPTSSTPSASPSDGSTCHTHTPTHPHTPLAPSPPPAAQLEPRTYNLEPPTPLAPSRYSLAADVQPRLLIIGDGPERAALEAIAKELPSVTFTGRLSSIDLHAHMATASVLVLPSTCYETFAMAVNEAAALGTPAIVSDIGGQASLVEDGVTGYTFASDSAESLAETLAKAMADSARLAAMGRHAQARFHAGDCPPERNVEALCATYGHSVAVRRCQPPPACGH